MRLCTILIAGLATTMPALATASSDDAWEEFRTEVGDACTALADAPEGAEVTVDVNPFGSESYGAAIVTVSQGAGEDRMICIYDKQEKSAEMTAPFTPDEPAE